MQKSDFIHQINRSSYYYRNTASSILRSRSYTLGNSIKIAIKEPFVFAKKAAHLFLRNPRKLFQIAIGKRTIQNFAEGQQRLTNEYQEWIENNERSEITILEQKKEIAKFKKKPLVSLITPVFDPPVDAHNKLIESVLSQSYENVELLLFNFGTRPEVRELLDDWASKDKRVVVKHDLPNGGIGKNSNYCLDYVTGDYVGLLDHDDALTLNAIYECVKAVNEHDADFVYSDKDKISEDDVRHEPLFKPNWSPEMALGGNYLTHFDLMRTKIVKDLGGWDPKTDGAQDWDLFLRILDETDKIVHIPKILYHWRTVQGSTSTSVGVKPYALAAQRVAVNKHLKRINVNAEAVQDENGQMFIQWPIENKANLFIVNMSFGDYGQVEKIVKFLKEDKEFNRSSSITIFIAEQFQDEALTAKLKEEFPEIEIVLYQTDAFVKSVGDYVAPKKIDNVIYLTDSTKQISSILENSNWISQLTGWLEMPGVNIAGVGTYAENGQVVDVGSIFDPSTNSFEKLYFSTGFRSGYNGYIQWIRNLILVSERVTAFSPKFFSHKLWNELSDSARDDELLKALALLNFANSGRAVYDPSVSSVDSAPFYVKFPISSGIKEFVNKYCRSLNVQDPYYNTNLDNNYIDPRPKDQSVRYAGSGYSFRSTDLPN